MRKKIAVKRVNLKELNLFDKVPNFFNVLSFQASERNDTLLFYKTF
jgi:hypothetical protein